MEEVSILKTSALIDEKSHVFLQEIKKRIGRKRYSSMLNSIFIQVVIKYAKLNKPVLRKTVKYQEKKKFLKLFHYSIDPVLYEACLDARKVNKISVSFLLNEAIRKLISVSSEKISAKRHNCFSNFISLISKLDNYHIGYTICINFQEDALIQTSKTRIKFT
ncbi:MAG TPA: hypothetical protein PLA54_00910 [Spirochaetota bacterium]|mgnify:FL=1|nr:hypothetical protein [Spirochaetota bacterium]HQE57729.1 hypothetical protein [Spirochaetota bacterium]